MLFGRSHAFEKGFSSRDNRLRAFMRQPIAQRYVAGIRGVDIARYWDGQLKKVSSATTKRDLILLGHVFKEWGIQVYNPVRDIKLPANGKAHDR